MNIIELQSNNYHAINSRADISDYAKKNQKKSVDYIGHLSNMTNTNINKWDLTKIFSKDGKNLYTDPREINVKFFAYADVEEKVPDTSLTKEVQETLHNYAALFFNSSRSDLESRALSDYRKFESYQRESLRFLAKSREYRRLMEEVNLFEKKIIGEISGIIDDGFFKFVKRQGDQLIFETINPVVVKYHHKKRGQDFTINFGIMGISIDAYNKKIMALKGKDNVTVNTNVIHPHFKLNGSCMGREQTKAQTYLIDCELRLLMKLVQNILLHPNEDDPLVSIVQFYNKANGLNHYHPYYPKYDPYRGTVNAAGYRSDGTSTLGAPPRDTLILSPEQKEELEKLIKEHGKDIIYGKKKEKEQQIKMAECAECGEPVIAREGEECDNCGYEFEL